jgi:glycosyltransferase involved in cell wall biosynthesis
MAAGGGRAALERVIVVHGDRGAAVDGIRDHTERLVGELARRSLDVTQLDLPTGVPRRGTRSLLARRLGALDPSAAVVLQYSPFCYGRRGFAPWLPADLMRLRARRGRPRLAVMIHEPYVPIDSWRSTVMGLWQRLQLGSLRLAADAVFASIEPWARKFAAHLPHRPAHHLPVGSNFPDARGGREEERRRLGVSEETIVVACLGRDHPTWLGGHVVEAVNAIARDGRPVALLTLGADAPRLDGLGPGVALHAPGYLGAAELAAGLAAADLFLAPVSDGVSTRRGSVMAALQHGLPVVGTDGNLTDPILRREGRTALFLTGVGEREQFAASAVALAADAEARAAAGAAARALYEREFDWPVIAGRLLAALPER